MANELNPSSAKEDFSSGAFASEHFAIVVSSYNDMITGKLMDGAVETLVDHGVAHSRIDVVRVPGAWELALGASQLATTGRYKGIVCLGAVIRGETTHDQHINRFVSQAVGDLSLKHNLPIAFGLLTCNTFEQAHERSGGKVGNKGHEATLAMLEMVKLTRLTDQM